MKNQLEQHPAAGAVFEGYVLTEWLKRTNALAKPSRAYYLRDQAGHEIDFLLERPQGLAGIEVKASHTFRTKMLSGLNWWRRELPSHLSKTALVYLDNERFRINDHEAIPWQELDKFYSELLE